MPRKAQVAAMTLLKELPQSADPRMDRRLRDMGLTVDFRQAVNLNKFDEERSLKNQVRVGKPLDPELVDTYAAKLRDGEIFPAIVAWDEAGQTKMMICDGNHRYAAAKQAGQDTVDAYLIDGDPMAIQIFMYTINGEHGKPLDEETRVHHALYFVDAGKTLREAAGMVGVKLDKVSRAYRLRDASNRADALRINRVKFDALNQGVREKLSVFETDEVFKAITQLAIDAHLSADDVVKARRDLASERSVAKQLKYIEGMRDALSTQIGIGKLEKGRGTQKTTARMQVHMTVGAINAWPDVNQAVALMTPQDRQKFAPRVKEARTRLEALEAALEKQE